eukprot:3418851-Rhodomonas_salina.2
MHAERTGAREGGRRLIGQREEREAGGGQRESRENRERERGKDGGREGRREGGRGETEGTLRSCSALAFFSSASCSAASARSSINSFRSCPATLPVSAHRKTHVTQDTPPATHR